MKKIILAYCLMLLMTSLHAQTIAEKKAGLSYVGSDLSEEMQKFLKQVNDELERDQQELRHLHSIVLTLYSRHATPSEYQALIERMKEIKAHMQGLETRWRDMAAQNQLEGYALWHQPDTTLEQLIIDYGAQEYAYLIPPEVASITLSINSNLPIPRAAWDEMLDLILTQNGVGVKQLNPFLRELYLLNEDHSNLKLITNTRSDLEFLPSNDRIAFLLTPEPSDVRRIWSFLDKFSNHRSTVIQPLGRDILIVAKVGEVRELIKLYDFALEHRGTKDYRLVPLRKVDAEEMTKILNAVFGYLNSEGNEGYSGEENGLKIITLGQVSRAVFLVGTKEEIRKAENIIDEVEGQVGDARAKEIFWYTAKHSDPEELAEVLEKIYSLMIANRISEPGQEGMPDGAECPMPPPPPEVIVESPPPLPVPYEQGFFLTDDFVVNRMPRREREPVNQGRNNFIVDLKSGAIVMVVESDILPKIKDLLKKLDVPKKMVQIEVLLFEKKLHQENDFGLNLLRIGDIARNVDRSSASFNDFCEGNPFRGGAGVFEFLISRAKCSGIPAYDIMYKFLLAQDDVQINASPSVLAVNQTPATIEIAEEISVNTGIFEVETVGGVTLKDQFARAQYGIKIGITPTVHMAADLESEEAGGPCREPSANGEDWPNYVTLETDITFQTFKPSNKNRPDVTTRHIVNEVRIADGQTVILGGLRQKTSRDRSESIPFLGEIPGIGKLFSITQMHDDGTEMFVFITPKIITDPCEELERIKLHQMCLRPGDIPEFLCTLVEAEKWERQNTLQGSMRILFGRTPERCIASPGCKALEEYDGR